MNSLAQLDALCLPSMIADNPVTVGIGGTDYTGTTGARDTLKSLTDGGFINDQEFTILIETAQFGTNARPAERSVVTVCVDADGIPCHVDDSTGRINARVIRIGRAGAGLTLTLGSSAR